MKYLDIYIRFIFLIKILFLILLLVDLYLKKKHKDTKLQVTITEWKDKLETLFIILMSLFLIYLFNPFVIRSVVLDYEAKLLLFVFGFISIILRLKDTFFVK